MRSSSCALLLSSLVALLPHVAAAEALHRTWTLYHSLDPKLGAAGFTKRGVVTLTSSDDATDGLQLTVENDEEAALEALSISQMMESGWYQLQLVEEGSPSSVVPVQTTIPACQLRRANFRDELVLTFGQHGHVLSMAYTPLVSPLAPRTCDDLPPPDTKKAFSTKVNYETASPGMVLRALLPSYQPPPGLKFIAAQKASPKTMTGLPGLPGATPPPPDGFGTGEKPEAAAPEGLMGYVQKYWYLWLPLLIMNSISTQGSAEEAAPADGAPAVAPAAAAPKGAATKGAAKRRTKRG